LGNILTFSIENQAAKYIVVQETGEIKRCCFDINNDEKIS
jgi:hypothetical protein